MQTIWWWSNKRYIYIYLMGCKQFGGDPTKEIKNSDWCMCREERGKVKEYKIIIVYVSCGRKVK